MNVTAIRGDGNVSLRWDLPSDSGGFKSLQYWVFRGDSIDDLVLITKIEGEREYLDQGLENGRVYFYSVMTVNEVGMGPRSMTINVIPARVPSRPLHVTSRVSDGSVVLSWMTPEMDGGDPIIRYILLRGVSPDDIEVISDIPAGLNFTDLEVEEGITYYYQVAAENGMGRGVPSLVVEVKVRKDADDSPFPSALLTIIALGIVMTIMVIRRRSWE